MKEQHPSPASHIPHIPHIPHRRDTELDPAPDSTARRGSAGELPEPSGEPPITESRLPPRLPTLRQSLALHPLAWRMLAACAVVACVLTFIVGIRSSSPGAPLQTAPDTRQFSIGSRPTLVFEHFIGNVNITPGPSGQVTIRQKENGETDAIQVHYAQHGDTVTVTVDVSGGLMEDTWVDFDVQVPAHAGVTARMATGTLEATDLSGRIVLTNTNGAIGATNLTGSTALKTQSGSISLTNVTGQVAAFTENGTITTTVTHLQGHSSVQAESGTINFHGTLSRTGSYVFRNGNGSVGLTLPSNSAFALDARSASGSINSDFRGVAITLENGFTQARGTVGAGAGAGAHLSIQTAGGSIDLHQGS